MIGWRALRRARGAWQAWVLVEDLDVWVFVGERRTKRAAVRLAQHEAAVAAKEVAAHLHFE